MERGDRTGILQNHTQLSLKLHYKTKIQVPSGRQLLSKDIAVVHSLEENKVILKDTWPDGASRFPGLYVTCPKVGLITAFLHYLPEIFSWLVSQEIQWGIKKM